MRCPYSVLGVSKTAKTEELKSAYRQLAKSWHPDQNPEDPQAGERFAEISLAYKLLSDPDLRTKFDNGDIDARGRRKAKPSRGFTTNPFKAFKEAMAAAAASGPEPASAAREDGDASRFEEMLAHIFGETAARESREAAAEAQTAERTGRRKETKAPGLDQDPLDALDELFAQWKARQKPKSGLPVSRHEFDITLESVLAGTRSELVFSDGQTVGFSVPAGTSDGAEIRVPSPDPAALGDAIVKIRYIDHPHLRPAGADLHGDHPIDLAEAVLGGSFVFKGLDGPLRIDIPEWSGSDTVLRIADKGLPAPGGGRGALHVHLRVMLPEKPDPRLVDLMRSSRKAWFM